MTYQIPGEVAAEIDKWIAKYPDGRQEAAVMAALRKVQEALGGWLTTEAMDAVADYLKMPKIAVYEVATFYSMYELEPVGRHKIALCTNVSCMLCGSNEIATHIKKRLGIDFGQTTADEKFTLKSVECLGACGAAPMMQIGNQYHENLTPEKVDSILEGLK